ncbi:MAG: PQQ-binding-like beta-propeller repeat protein [Candidatus Riflebacteria bacterium]|nr:PQQ-binding-like beta-propeller repeat protein [Candidatus Riflebacteria bacterium]
MDDVAIATSNPVKPMESSAHAAPVKAKPVGTFINFFLMMPLAVVLLLQGFFIGRSFGNFTTFPFYTIQSYMTLGALAALMVVIQMMMRSIIYSTLFGFMLVSGIFHAWFGDFLSPLRENFAEVLSIMKHAWSNKDIPYPILMSTIVTTVLLIASGVNFIFALFTKYFFEIVFGREWGDGRKSAYFWAIVLLGICYFGFGAYAQTLAPGQRLLWEQRSFYRPIEEYCSRIPSAGIVSKERIWSYDTTSINAFDSGTGAQVKEKAAVPSIPAPMWIKTELPILGTSMGLISYDRDLLSELWTCAYPASLPGLVLPPEDVRPDQGVPLLIRPDIRDGVIFCMFDYGYWGAVDTKDGHMLWIKPIDGPSKINRYFVEDFIRSPYLVSVKDVVVFACYNGRVIALKVDTGETVWEYVHPESKFEGKGQRAYLSIHENRVLAAFPSGSLVTFDAVKGTKIYEASSQQWHPISAASWEGDEAGFISSDGSYVRVAVDGGHVFMRTMLYYNKPYLMPAPKNLDRCFAAYKDSFFQIATATKELKDVCRFPKHTFACSPVVDESFVYTGTQDGWVMCFHKDSLDEKWRVHLSGELSEESLCSSDAGLLVRTRSGSVYCLKKGMN